MLGIINDAQKGEEDSAWSTLSLGDLDESKGKAFYSAWLDIQCSAIKQVSSALLLVKDDVKHEYQARAVWPQPAIDLQVHYDIIEQVVKLETGLIHPLSQDHNVNQAQGKVRGGRYAVAYPICHNKEVFAVVAIVLDTHDKAQLQGAMRQLQWGSAWVELAYASQVNDSAMQRYKGLASGVDILATVLSEPHYDASAFRLVAELSRYLQCELVCLGVNKGQSLAISHISNTAQHGKKMARVKAMEAAMREAADQHKSLCWPADKDSGAILFAHEKLGALWPDHQLLTVPLYVDEKCTSVMAFIRHIDLPFSLHERQQCEHMLAFNAVALEEKRLNSRSLWKKNLDDMKQGLAFLLGPKHIAKKMFAIIFIAALVSVTVIQGNYRLSADAVVATAMQRVIVAPFDAYIDNAPYRAGDMVSQGELMVRFDDRDLRLEQLRLESERSQLEGKSQEAAARYDRSEITIINAQIAQVQAKMRLVENSIQRAQQLAPFDGVVVSGDLSEKLGAAVTKGDILFEVAPADQLRVFLNIKESRIADIALGQKGQLYLSALPQSVIPIHISKITPVTSIHEGASYFRVEATLDETVERLQPGMEGIGKVSIDRRKLVSIWGRSTMEWFRLKFWSMWG